MTAIDVLLEKAGELSGAGLSELAPVLAEMADAQASMAEALAPFYEITAGIAGLQPFSYGFRLPAEPPEVKADLGEQLREPGPAEVTLGPINVYQITKEIRQALDTVGKDSTDIQAIYSDYATPGALAEIRSQAGEPPASFAPGPASQGRRATEIVTDRTPEAPVRPAGMAGPEAPRQRSERSEAKAESRQRPAEEWVEKSVRRSAVIIRDLQEIRRDFAEKPIAETGEIGREAPAIGSALAEGYRAPAVAGKPAETEEPPRQSPPAQVAGQPGRVRPDLAGSPPSDQARPKPAPEAGAPVASKAPGLPNIVEAPVIRPRAKSAPLPGDAEYNAGKLSEALARSIESGRGPTLPDHKPEEPAGLPPVKWPQRPEQGTREARVPEAARAGEPSARAEASARAEGIGPIAGSRATAVPDFGSPVAQVLRSFGAMNAYVRTVSEIGRQGLAVEGPAMPVSTGALLAGAMIGMPTAVEPLPAPGADVARESLPGALSGRSSAAGTPAALSGSPQAPAFGLAAGMAAAQSGQRSGIAMIQQLMRATPRVPGTIAPQPPAAYDAWSGLAAGGSTSVATASGAENIVNITVPPSGGGKVAASSTTTKVANYHNTFNITVNVKGGEEKDLKELGRKIGQILSDEMKRYGGV